MIVLFGLVILVLDVIALAKIIQSTMTAGMKVLWGLVVVALPVVGMPLYFAYSKQT